MAFGVICHACAPSQSAVRSRPRPTNCQPIFSEFRPTGTCGLHGRCAVHAREDFVFGYEDTRMKLPFATELAGQGQTLAAMHKAAARRSLAIQLLHGFGDAATALNEQVDKSLGTTHDATGQIRQLISQVKHDVDANIANGLEGRSCHRTEGIRRPMLPPKTDHRVA